jgi:DNA (cytosine-5)-methyltransferase 1
MTAIHLCCGGGGTTLGFEQAGIQGAFAFDLDPVCVESHRLNFGDVPCEVLDMRDVRGGDLPAAEVITCGIPCEPYSIAGQRRLEADPRDLSADVARLLGEIEAARCVFLENVPLFARSAGAEWIRAALREAGYGWFEAIFAHADYGVAQKRKRWHLLASRNGLTLPRPEPTRSEYPGFGTQPWVRFGAIREVSPSDPHYLSARAWKGILRRQTRAEARAVEGDFDTCYAKCYIVDDEDLMPTVLSSSYKGPHRNQATVVYDDGRFRAPTELEMRRAQGFPDTFRLAGNKRQRYEQIGRAVPPPFAAAVARAILAAAGEAAP